MTKILVRVPTLDRSVLLPAKKAEALRTTITRSSTLTKAGYKLEAVVASDGLFFCRSPKPVTLPDGELADGYQIDVCRQICECWQWVSSASEGVPVCKHLLWATPQIQEALRVLGLWSSPEPIDEVAKRINLS